MCYVTRYVHLQALDDINLDFPAPPSGASAKQHEAYKSLERLRAVEREEVIKLASVESILTPPSEDVLLCHARNAPATRTTYDPKNDAHEGQMAIIRCEAGEGEEPWDIVRITKIHPVQEMGKKEGPKFFDAVHLEPTGPSGYLRHGIYKLPDDWYKKPLKIAEFWPGGRQRKGVRLQHRISTNLDINCIQFSSNLNDSGTIKKNMLKHVLEAVKACTKGALRPEGLPIDDAFDDGDG
jgi:hypothetical protein